jgi:thioredoxin 1
MLSLIIPLAIGAAVGAALGYFGQCSSGTCPLTSTWWRGALYGAGMGLVFYFVSGRNAAGPIQESKNVRAITATEFDTQVVGASQPVVVDFYAPWCGPCRKLAPMLDKLAAPLKEKVSFVKVNVDEAPELAQRFQIQGIPTLIFFKDGKVVDRITGMPRQGDLKTRLETLAGRG